MKNAEPLSLTPVRSREEILTRIDEYRDIVWYCTFGRLALEALEKAVEGGTHPAEQLEAVRAEVLRLEAAGMRPDWQEAAEKICQFMAELSALRWVVGVANCNQIVPEVFPPWRNGPLDVYAVPGCSLPTDRAIARGNDTANSSRTSTSHSQPLQQLNWFKLLSEPIGFVSYLPVSSEIAARLSMQWQGEGWVINSAESETPGIYFCLSSANVNRLHPERS